MNLTDQCKPINKTHKILKYNKSDSVPFYNAEMEGDQPVTPKVSGEITHKKDLERTSSYYSLILLTDIKVKNRLKQLSYVHACTQKKTKNEATIQDMSFQFISKVKKGIALKCYSWKP